MSGLGHGYLSRYVSIHRAIDLLLTLEAIFILGYITLVFGFETAWRSLRSERFAARGKWNTTVCIVVVSFLLLLTWMPTIVWPASNRCFGSLIWYPMRYDLLTLVILSVLVFLCLLLAAIISIQLMRTSGMDPNERISASRMSYYLLVIALIYVSNTKLHARRYLTFFRYLLCQSRYSPCEKTS